MSSTSVRGLFGGAITAVTPSHVIDASTIRQVPDTQEVFVYPDCSISIITEILEKVEPIKFDDAIRYHFDSLAHDNDAQSSQVLGVNVIPNDRGDNTPSAIILSGIQHVQKFNRTSPDEVRILMALYRVESKNVDVVVTFNVPIKSEDGGAVGEQGWDAAQADFDAFAKSLRIVNYDLFA